MSVAVGLATVLPEKEEDSRHVCPGRLWVNRIASKHEDNASVCRRVLASIDLTWPDSDPLGATFPERKPVNGCARQFRQLMRAYLEPSYASMSMAIKIYKLPEQHLASSHRVLPSHPANCNEHLAFELNLYACCCLPFYSNCE